jgi:hypothetical protein
MTPALQSQSTHARQIGELIPRELQRATRGRSRKPRGDRPLYRTWGRLRLLAAVAERPAIGTADAAGIAGMHREWAHRALTALAGANLIRSKRSGRGAKRLWEVTPEGLEALFKGVNRKCAELSMGSTEEGYSHVQSRTLSVVLESTHQMAKRLRKLGWNRQGVEHALRIHRIDYLMRQLRQVQSVPGVRSVGALLRFRLLNPAASQKRREGVARMLAAEGIKPEAVAAYLVEAASLPPRLFLRLGYGMRKLHRKGLTVTAGDVMGLAGGLRKKELMRRVPALE